MTPQELGRLFPIRLEPWNPEYAERYAGEKERILARFLPGEIAQIDHIGSTAIPGILSKPTIDILLQVAQEVSLEKIMAIFRDLDYQYIPKPENPPPHMMFVKGYTPEGFRGQAFHVHVRYPGNWDEIPFRDYLTAHPALARQYEKIKQKLASRHRFDRDAYTLGKTEFVEKINQRARKYNQRLSN